MSIKYNLIKQIPKNNFVVELVAQDAKPELNFLTDLDRNKILNKAERFKFKGKAGESCWMENLGDNEAVAIVGLGENPDRNSLVQAASRAVKLALGARLAEIAFVLPSEIKISPDDIGYAVAYAVELANYSFDVYKKDDPDNPKIKIKKVNFLETGDDKKFISGIERGQAVAAGVMLTRDLVNHPPVRVNPNYLAETAQDLAKASNNLIKVEVLDKEQCEKLGMGAYLAVAKGSDIEPKFIILSYEPDQSTEAVALVGKSITFDSGGLSLKPSDGMMDMKCDMSGGAAVLGLFKTLVMLQGAGIKQKVYGVLPACDNMPSGHATCPGDIVTAMSGKTVEILNTDAEGRLALADALHYAQDKLKAKKVIDLATLTGACMVALGTDIAAILGNSDELINILLSSAEYAGEPLWQLPLRKEYRKNMDSTVADIKNIGGGRYAGTITAGLFLQDFVEEKTKWAHLDIAGPAFKTEGSDLHPKGATGYGVALLFDFLTRDD